MNATLTKQFEGFAECCLELARSAETTERRARFIQMAHEYRLATLLTSEELSSGPKGRRLLSAESPLLIAAEAPASRAQTRPQPRLFARSAAPRHPGFKAQMFDADKQNRDLSNRDQGGNAGRTGHVNTEIDRLLHRCRAWLFRTLANALFDPYRPELHYMRGPGPKCSAKYRRAR